MENISYSVPDGVVSVERVIKRSRFVASVARGRDREEAEEFIKSVRNLHPAASHNCYAFLACPPGGEQIGFGDDGEVSGTAGRPMLTLLEHSGIGEIVAVVSRYFGGVKLGPGGLMRAYTGCLKAALEELRVKNQIPTTKGYLVFPYAHENSIRVLFEKTDVSVTKAVREERVFFDIEAPVGEVGELEEKIASLTRGEYELVWK